MLDQITSEAQLLNELDLLDEVKDQLPLRHYLSNRKRLSSTTKRSFKANSLKMTSYFARTSKPMTKENWENPLSNRVTKLNRGPTSKKPNQAASIPELGIRPTKEIHN